MKTESIVLQTLCVPCACRCRYCLLSWDGRPVGAPWDRAAAFARAFRAWQRQHRPDLRFAFTFGYSMEHPQLRQAIRLLRELGSPQSEFLQCDGMRMRSGAECRELGVMLAEEGVKHLNFTFYGLPDYHDRFAGRPGDFSLLLRLLRAAVAAGLTTSARVPLTAESITQAGELISLLKDSGCADVTLFIPHEEGRGVLLAPIRLTEKDLRRLPDDACALLDRRVYRSEREWLAPGALTGDTRRSLILSLTGENVARCERADPAALIAELEALDDAYYAAFPPPAELAARCGDPNGDRLYSRRDLLFHYRRLYAREFPAAVYDVTDERYSGSRRY